MVRKTGYPEIGEFVVTTVKEVKGFGAFVVLEEYPGKEGFIHIAELATGWVKYVRDHVRENQKVVCKVLSVDRSKGHIDLSLKRVNERQRRDTISAWKNEQKAEKLLEMLAKKAGKTVDAAYKEFAYALAEAYGTLYAAFETAAMDEDDFKKEQKGTWVAHFLELARDNVAIPFVEIGGTLKVSTAEPDGIEHIKKALLAAQETEFEDVQITVRYLGAPRYRLKARAPDYKIAEDEIRKAAERVTTLMAQHGGVVEFLREEAPKKP